MPVTNDEMYRQLCADYFHHLQWREKLFGGFFVLIGVLVAAYYSTYTNDNSNKLKDCRLVIPLAGSVLSFIFAMLDKRCHEVLLHRRYVGRMFEINSGSRGVFKSAWEIGNKNKENEGKLSLSHSCILQLLYWGSGIIFVGFFIFDFIPPVPELHSLFQCFLMCIKTYCLGSKIL